MEKRNPAEDLKAYDAIICTLAAAESFLSLPWAELNTPMRAGAVLLFEGIVSRYESLLPSTSDLQHVHKAIAQSRALAREIRARVNLPPHV